MAVMPVGDVAKVTSVGAEEIERIAVDVGEKLTAKEELPALDVTGKVHGVLPKIKSLGKYSKDELEILLKELKQSVQRRIEEASRLGRDRAHGQRIGAEQDLIKAIEKRLKK